MFMSDIISSSLEHIILISLPFSVILMAFIQKLKKANYIKSKHIIIFNLLFSFLLGIPYGIVFYDLDLKTSIWISIFGFVGAPSLYEALKKQNFINYKPDSSK